MSLTNPNKVVTEERLSEFYQSILPYLGGMPEAVSVKDDLPVGTTIYVDGKTVPEGYLLCDGSTKTISSYPVLATYFQTQHGKKNYYGGNGTSTFGLPSIKNMPYETDNNYEGGDKIVGIWNDGKPVHRYTEVVTISPASSFVYYVRSEIANMDAFIDYKIQVKGDYTRTDRYFYINPNKSSNLQSAENKIEVTDNGGGYNDNPNLTERILTFINTANNNTAKAWITIYYTKTSDSTVPAGYSPDGNGIWCIKAKTMTTEDYSTDEKIVGTWVDGSPIYERTFTSSLPTGNTEFFINIGTAVSYAWIKKASFINPSKVCFTYPATVIDDDYTTAMAIRIFTNAASTNQNKISVKCKNQGTYYITIQYIKV